MDIDISSYEKTQRVATAFHSVVHALWHERMKNNDPVSIRRPIKVSLDSDESGIGKSTFLQHHFDVLSDVDQMQYYDFSKHMSPKARASGHLYIVWKSMVQTSHGWEVLTWDAEVENTGYVLNQMYRDGADFKEREYPGIDFVEHGFRNRFSGDEQYDLRVHFSDVCAQDGNPSLTKKISLRANDDSLFSQNSMSDFFDQITDLVV